MNYRFAAPGTDPNRILLVRARTAQILLSLFLFITAIAVLPAGLLLFFGDADPHLPFFFTGMGLFLLSTGIALNTLLRLPNSLAFDNVTGCLVITEGRGARARRAVVPYPDIDTFQVRPHRQGRSTAYVTEMLKKDGAFWTLFITGSEKKAAAFRDRLLERVSLRPTSAAGEPEAPSCVSIAEEGGATVIAWKNRYSAGRHLLTVMLVGSMAMLIYGSRPYAESGVAYWAAMAFIAVVILVTLWTFLDSIGRGHRVEIDGAALSYRKTGGIARTGSFTIPLGEIDSILFNFSVTSGETAIYVLTAPEKEAIQAIKRGEVSLDNLLQALVTMKNARKLDVGALDMGDRLSLEGLIQKAVERRTGAPRRTL